ncbi:hypothetical protein CYMTET_30483, partial [Cymbomonas tetramitiformis]
GELGKKEASKMVRLLMPGLQKEEVDYVTRSFDADLNFVTPPPPPPKGSKPKPGEGVPPVMTYKALAVALRRQGCVTHPKLLEEGVPEEEHPSTMTLY